MLSPNYYHSRKKSLGNRALFCPKFGDLSPKLGIDKKNHYFLNRIGYLVTYMLVSRQLDHYNRALEKSAYI